MSESAPPPVCTNRAHAAGITPVELAERATVCAESPLSARALARWLVDGHLAHDRDGVLYPTVRAVELGGAID